MSTNSIHPKKNLAVLIHLACLILVIASISILYVNSNFGRGIAWIRSESYIESDLFYISSSLTSGQSLTMAPSGMLLRRKASRTWTKKSCV